MALFKPKNPFQFRRAFVDPGTIVYCGNCQRILPVGTDYNPSRPRCNSCYWT